MPIVGGLDIHRKQLTFDYLDTVTGEIKRGQIAPADRQHLRAWLARNSRAAATSRSRWRGAPGGGISPRNWPLLALRRTWPRPADTAALRGRKRHAKTDKTDSRHLRTLLAEGPAAGRRLDPAGAHPGVSGAA